MSAIAKDFPNFDAQTVASQGNAILGIRDSGKSYTAVEIAERFHDAGIPFVAFDPIGRWRFIRVPGKDRGYPVVVAGGQAGDLPLKPDTAASIVRAAMENGISLVIDLYDMEISKADWKRIVADCVRVLLYGNGKHGLRHIFIEEAAEFAPQRVGPDQGRVYAEIEKLARMGGNARLGYTLINQRAEEVNKAVLELCDNLFLHRQKGRNSLNALTKWLNVADVRDSKEIIGTLSTLPQGECWAWMAGTGRPVHMKVPPKNSFEPDRRAMRGDVAPETKKAVDVEAFVTSMQKTLAPKPKAAPAPKTSAEVEKSNTAALRDRDAAFQLGLKQGREGGYRDGWLDGERTGFTRGVAAACTEMKSLIGTVAAVTYTSGNPPRTPKTAKNIPENIPAPVAQRIEPRNSTPKVVGSNPAGRANGNSEQRIIDAIAWWNAMGIDAPSHPQVAFIAGYSHKSGTWSTYLSRLRSSGLIEGRGDLVLTDAGRATSNPPTEKPSGEALRATVLGRIDGPLQRILAPVLDRYPNGAPHSEIADEAGYSHKSGTWSTYLSRMRSLDLISKSGELRASNWLFPEAA